MSKGRGKPMPSGLKKAMTRLFRDFGKEGTPADTPQKPGRTPAGKGKPDRRTGGKKPCA